MPPGAGTVRAVTAGAAKGVKAENQAMIPSIQRGTQMMLRKAYTYRMLRLFSGVTAILIAIVALGCSSTIDSEPAGQKSFASPQQAVTALVAAVQDNNEVELLAILGPDSEDLISSGDKVADRNGRARFLKAYEEKNNLAQEDETRAVLLVGSKDYPFPIPISSPGKNLAFRHPGRHG